MDASRLSGILLHPTSLPSAYGVGDLGPAAHAFVDHLAQSQQRLWQVLPLGPVGPGASPYSSPSTFAGNPLLVSPARLLDQGLLTTDDVTPLTKLPADRMDASRLIPRKRAALQAAFERFDADASASQHHAFEQFWQSQSAWLDDYALYMALKDEHDGAAWTEWAPALVRRDPDALAEARERLTHQRRMHAFWQYLFDEQWSALRAYCHTNDVQLFGDLPIYVAHDSADVWANRDRFHLAPDGTATAVAGVPPDYFSPEGQLWGNPLYRWDRMRAAGYAWWIRRFRQALRRVDLIRLDHFRGFEAYWAVPGDATTAIHGEWREGPGADLFHALEAALGTLPVVAEDLGVITEPVRALRDQFHFPGMGVLQFAFNGDPSNEFLPHNYRRRLVAYTGTHDNNTLRGWWTDDLDPASRAQARQYLDVQEEAALFDRSLRMLMASVAERVITPLQDVMELGADARMNTPGQEKHNWTWRYTSDQLTPAMLDHLRACTETFGRVPQAEEETEHANGEDASAV